MDSSLSSADSDDEGIEDKDKKTKKLKKKKKEKKVRVSGPSAAPKVKEAAFAEVQMSSSHGRKVCCALQDPVQPERTETSLS